MSLAPGFNEASALQRRKPHRHPRRQHRHRASMRPPLFSGGNLSALYGNCLTEVRASMRPPLFSGGNVLRSPRKSPSTLLQ